MSFARLGPSIPIPHELQGVGAHLLPPIVIPDQYDHEAHLIGDPQKKHKVAELPGQPDVLIRWGTYIAEQGVPGSDAVERLEESHRQWQRFAEAGIPVVAHRHIHAGLLLNQAQGKRGLIMTAVERLKGAVDLNPRVHPSHIEPAITVINGLTTYANITLNTPDSFFAADLFKKLPQFSVIPEGASLRPEVSRLALHDLGFEYLPTFTTDGVTPSIFVSRAIRRHLLPTAAFIAQAAKGSEHAEAAHEAQQRATLTLETIANQ